MNVALRQPRMTRDEFLVWAQKQEARYEFDGLQPIAMNGGSANHGRISGNLFFALMLRLRGTEFEPFGPDNGVATVGDTVRYPDAFVTSVRMPGTSLLASGVVAVFEVVSPTSGRIDRIDKLLEYRAVPSIRCYVILEHTTEAITVFARTRADDNWTATALTADDVLALPELGIEIPVADLYKGVDLPP